MPTHQTPPAGETHFENAPPQGAALERALMQRLRIQTKPPGSLGLLEEVGLRLGRLQGTTRPKAETFRLCVFAGSHGIASQGVSAYPAEVTAQMVGNFLGGGAAVCVLARAAGASLHVVDNGVDFGVLSETGNQKILPTAEGAVFFKRSARRGTRCFSHEPAMLPNECDISMAAGREQVRLALADNIDVLGIGEMGIGNTTSAAALCAGILQAPANDVVGIGTGVDAARLARKIATVEDAVKLHAKDGDESNSARRWLECVGGYEIAAMTGCILAAAEVGLPILVDGFIASAAALVAQRLNASASDCCFFAHESAEKGHALLLGRLGATPLLHLGMRLGEGTGAALAFPLLRAAARLLSEMATFESAGVAGALPAAEKIPE
jgi:nicotinate-nucleotide--dimethylbenzimidazole phosphoribosyltransferase